MRRALRLTTLLPALVVFCTSFGAAAQTEMTGIRAMGMGEAFTAAAAGDGALFYNPAGVSALMMYSVEASYVFDQATGMSHLHASIVDGKSNPGLGGAVGYTLSLSGEDAAVPDFTGHDMYGVLSMPVIPGWLIVGSTVHYIDYAQFDTDIVTGITADAGALVSLADGVSFGTSFRNIIQLEGANRPRELRFGLSYTSFGFQLATDAALVFDGDGGPTTNVGVGAEYLAMQQFPIRLGYLNDATEDDQLLSAGVGWRSNLFGLDILYRQSLEISDRRSVGLAFNLYL